MFTKTLSALAVVLGLSFSGVAMAESAKPVHTPAPVAKAQVQHKVAVKKVAKVTKPAVKVQPRAAVPVAKVKLNKVPVLRRPMLKGSMHKLAK